MLDLLAAIDTRSSSLKLVEPGPTREQLERILQSGARAPDHGKLAPWRFVVLQGAARARLGAAMANDLRASNPAATAAQLAVERDKPLRAPTIVTVAARVTRDHKVPEHEQVHAVAAAVQNMFLTAHALGLGAMWKTGAAARSAVVKRALELQDDDDVVAFLYLGSNATPGPARAPMLDGKVTWLK